MSSFVRASKFRHVFCDPPRPEAIFSNLRLSTVTGEQNYIKANALFMATGVAGGGGPFAILNIANPGRFEPDNPVVAGHSAAVLDFDFNPFNDHIVASASEDQTIKIWGIPEGGLTKNMTEPLVDLHGHQRKVTLIRFHPTASNILASTAGDQTVKLWDIEKGKEINSCDNVHEQLIQELIWDYQGTQYITTSKDKHIRFMDARSAQLANKIETAHEGAKSTKLAYLGNFGKIVSVGFTRQSQRQFKIWDHRNLSTALKQVDIDQAAGVIMPFFDPDSGLLYLAGKGDGNVRFYEVINENPYCFPISECRTQVSAKGMAWVPKKGLNVMGCESARLLKLTTNSIEPLCFFVPRKSDAFQEDLYPDTYSSDPAHTGDEWLAGSDKAPLTMSLNPAVARKSSSKNLAPVVRVAAKTTSQLQAELDVANAKIKELEERLAAAGLSV